MKTYVIGHKKPDTDSVCSAISYSYLKNVIGLKCEPRVLGDLNKETKFVLKHFNIAEPKYLNDVKVQIRNMKYLKDAYVNQYLSIEEAFNLMHELNVSGLPVVDDNRHLVGYVNLKDICKYLIHGDIYQINTSYDNIVKILNGRELLRFDDNINGSIITAAYSSNNFTENISIDNNTILIVGDRTHILEYAIKAKAKLIILVGDNNLSDDLKTLAASNNVNVISTPDLTFLTNNKIRLSNYIINVLLNIEPITFRTSDYRDDFIDIATRYGHTNYPVLDMSNKCVGMLRFIDQNIYEKCNLILVDHNQEEQSVDGINEANILEVIDHHNLGTIGTNIPISFRTMPVGCTSTIIYQIYKELKVKIPKEIAGLMLSAILSDTLLLKSPTTTNMDKEVANILSEIAGVDIKEYGMQMFKMGTSIEGMDAKEILEQDFKTYKLDNGNIGISQVMTLDIDNIINNKDLYIRLLTDMTKSYNYKISIMFVTDIINNGSYIFYNEGAEDELINAYHLKEIYQGLYMPSVVSRKKQMLPNIMEYYKKN